MFGNNKKTTSSDSSSRANSSTSNAVNSLVAGTKIEGSIHATNDLRIDGEIDGNLECKGKLIIGKSGKIDGEVNCQNAVIEGKFFGKLNVIEVLHVKETAFIDGEVKTGQLIVESGGVINGNCTMGNKVKNFNTENPIKAVS